ncbi:MAG TPA: asparaginase [Candidatus Limnocylindrales bacterium]
MAERAQRTSPSPRGAARNTGTAASNGRQRRAIVAPVLVRVMRGDILEAEHRGHVVEVDASGRVVRSIGDPDAVVTLRSTVKPLGLVALVEAGGIEAFGLTSAELAIMASSHSGEDLHVRTLHDVFRRARISQSALACGVEHAPLDALTAARLARDGERPGPIRHNCSGNHAALLLLARLGDSPLDGYWEADHPAMRAFSAAVGRAFGTPPDRLVTAIDNCGILTYAFPLRSVAASYALLAAPDAIEASDPRASLAPAFRTIGEAMMGNPELVAGTRDRLDTVLMKAAPGRLVSKGGAEALRAIGLVGGGGHAPSGIAIKIVDGDGADRAGRAAAVETLAQVNALDDRTVRELGRYHRPQTLDSHGRVAAEARPSFELAPVGELV